MLERKLQKQVFVIYLIIFIENGVISTTNFDLKYYDDEKLEKYDYRNQVWNMLLKDIKPALTDND